MRKIAYSMIAMAMAAFTFSSCEDVPAPFAQPEDPGTGGGGSTVVVDPKGSGTEADPYNVAAAIEVAKALPQIADAKSTDETNSKDVVAEGYVSSINEIDTEGNYGNATYFISDDKEGKSNKLEIYRGYGLGGQRFNETGATIIKEGDQVVVSGKLVNFRGTLEFTQGSKIISINGQGGGGGETSDLEGAGTLENPYTAKDAIIIAGKLGANDSGSPAYVKGKVVTVSIDTSYGNATYKISADGTETDQFQIFRGLYFGGRNFTSTDQLKKGDDVVVYGNIINFMGNTPEMAQGSEIYSINNQTDSGEQPTTGPIGSQEEPISVTEALVLIDALADNATTDQEAYVKGTIKEIQTTAENIAKYKNIDYIITDGDSEIKVFRGKNLNNTDFTAEGQINVGDEVIVLGKLQKYVNNSGEVIPEIAQGNYLVSLTQGQGGGEEPISGEYGTLEEPLTVPEALEIAYQLPEISKASDANESNSMANAVVMGIIASIKNIDTGQYGNAEYYISDQLNSNYMLLVYRGYSLNGDHFKSQDEIKEGDEVVIQGTIVNFKGTLEFTSGSKILSLNGQTGTGGGNEPGGGEETSGSVTVVAADLGLGNQEKPSKLTLSDGTTLSFDGGGNNNAPAYYNSGSALRMYPKNSMVIDAGNKKIASLEFICDESNGNLYNASGDITVNDTKMTIDGTSLKFTGPNASTATVKNVSTGTGAPSQLRMKTIIITYVQ